MSRTVICILYQEKGLLRIVSEGMAPPKYPGFGLLLRSKRNENGA